MEKNMKRQFILILFAVVFGFVGALTAKAQDWSEYSRGSDAWHRHNRDAMYRPWKYDRGGRLKRGKSSGRNYYVRKRRRKR